MLQTNLIYGIQKKIKEGRTSDLNRSKAGVLEESTEQVKTKEILLENYYNPGILSGISAQVEASKKKTVNKGVLMMEAFHLAKAEKKLNKDITYFNYLYENFVDDVFKESYETLLEGIFEDSIRLYQECDVTPRVISPAIDSNELTENQIVDLYKNNLNNNIKENYTKPLLSGKISELFESEMKILTKKLLEENVVADAEQVRIYLPFEETLYRFNREVIIPKTAESRMDAFMESTTAEYTDLLEECAADILKGLEKKIKLLTSMVSPNMFDKAVDAEGVDAPKMAGVSITVDKNFNEEPEVEVDALGSTDAAEAEADEELADETEAGEMDIAQAEEDARDQTDLVSDVDDLESEAAENRAELSPAEAAGEDDQPGAVEGGLPLADANQDSTGYASNSSDVELQGQGNDNGVDVASSDATLPGGAASGTSDVNQDVEVAGDTVNADDTSLSSDASPTKDDTDLSTSSNSLPTGDAELPGAADESVPNDSDQSISSGSATAEPVSVTSEEVGEDGDDNNVGGEMVDSEDEEVNTETPSEDQMDEIEKDKDEVNASITPKL